MASAKRSKSIPVKPITDHDNALGKAYAAVLRERIQVLKSGLALTRKTRDDIAYDLVALVWFAENNPEVFGLIRATERSSS